ncbi:MAG: GNAT family N-acetyltransferase [Myxococcales bacterium]|nr:MAG: GNAT family N-acetyltransferase [Myxococcales bacterium]
MTQTTKTTYDPNWREKYKAMIVAADEAVMRIQPGKRVFVGTGCGQPQTLVGALAARGGELSDVEIVHLLTMGDAPYAEKKLAQHFRVNSFFIAQNVRAIIQEGMGGYTPISLSDIPRLFKSGQLPLDVALIQVSPPDEAGLCSFGVSVDIVKSAAENAGLVIAEVNPRMPRTLGDSLIHVYDLDLLVPVDAPILEVVPMEPDDVVKKIGEYVAALVENGSTIELGIGRIPHAVIDYLKEKRDLGIHTEMLTDRIIDLIESGAVTGERKGIDRGKVVASFCFGTRRLYDYIDNNPKFSFRPTEYVNDPRNIARHDRMTAINTALEVDLTGQVCSDSLGAQFYSGFGGQLDFSRGAGMAAKGKPIIALPSTAKGGHVSRIVPRLSPGAGVVTTRADVHYVVTEWGVAYLHGKNIQERAMALITIAHPDHRGDLLRAAIEAKFVRPELADVEGKLVVEPPGLRTTMRLNDGMLVNFRPIHPTDEPRMRDLLYDLSKSTIYYRFGMHLKRFPQKQIQDFVYVDHRDEVAIVGTVPEAHGDSIIAIGRYYLDKSTNLAEVAMVTRDPWQNRGIGSFVLKYLAQIAKRNGIRGFTAEILLVNKPMQRVLYKLGGKISSTLSSGVLHFEVEFE